MPRKKSTDNPKPKPTRRSSRKIPKSAEIFKDPNLLLLKQQAGHLPSTSTPAKESLPSDQRTQLDDLPNELLVNIFKFLPLFDQRRSRRVSRRWRSNLNSPLFFRHVTLCNAALLGLHAINRYLKGNVNAETRSLILSCSTRGAIYILANVASVKILRERCPLLDTLSFINGKLPLSVLQYLPASVRKISFCNVYVVDERGRVLVVYRNTVDVHDPMQGPETLYTRLATNPGKRLR